MVRVITTWGNALKGRSKEVENHGTDLPFAVTSLLASFSFSVPLAPCFYLVLCV